MPDFKLKKSYLSRDKPLLEYKVRKRERELGKELNIVSIERLNLKHSVFTSFVNYVSVVCTITFFILSRHFFYQ